MQWLKAVVRFIIDYARWIPVVVLYAVSCYITYFSVVYLDILTTIWLIVHIIGYPIVAYQFLVTKTDHWAYDAKRSLKEGLLEDDGSCYIGLLVACYLWPVFLVGYLIYMLYTTVVKTYIKLDTWSHDQASSKYVYKFYIHYRSSLEPQVYSIYNSYSEAKLAEKAWLEKADMLLVATTYIKREKRDKEKQ